MGKSLTPDQKAEAAAEELRALIREAHEAAQAVNEASKQARRQVEEYLEHSLVQIFKDYQAATQKIIEDNVANIEATAKRYQQQLRAAFQVVADGHTRVYLAMIEHLRAGTDKPDDLGPMGLVKVRERIVKAGDELVAAYRAAGVQAVSAFSLEGHQDALDRAKAENRWLLLETAPPPL